jgi:acyl-CoA thioesterase
MKSMPYINQDHYAQSLGVVCFASSQLLASCRLDINDQHLNGVGTVHGAVIYALADIAFACACNAGEHSFIGLQTELRFMGKVQGTQLLARAELVSSSTRFLHYQVIVTDEHENKVALFIATAYRIST